MTFLEYVVIWLYIVGAANMWALTAPYDRNWIVALLSIFWPFVAPVGIIWQAVDEYKNPDVHDGPFIEFDVEELLDQLEDAGHITRKRKEEEDE